MKKVLVIGSTVADVIIELVDHLPATGEDVHVKQQKMSLGGCAFNVSDSIRHFQVPYILFSPVGSGPYGNFVRENLKKRGIISPVPAPEEENGCCYCFIESTGERTFISYHGAEYRFRPEWFHLIDLSEIDTIYICGLEIEEETGIHILSFLKTVPKSCTIYFAPGPRLTRIRPELLSDLYTLRPILHLNQTEAENAAGIGSVRTSGKDSGLSSIQKAARVLYQKTNNTVIITLGSAGCFYYDGTREEIIPAFPVCQTDTNGAGDAHIGSFIACRKLGYSIPQAIRMANRVSSAVVMTPGALLPDEVFNSL